MFKMLLFVCSLQPTYMECRYSVVDKGYPSMEVCQEYGQRAKDTVEEEQKNLRVLYTCKADT